MTMRYTELSRSTFSRSTANRSLLLPPDQVVRLSLIGTAIFAAAAGPTSVEAITAVVVGAVWRTEDLDALAAVREF